MKCRGEVSAKNLRTSSSMGIRVWSRVKRWIKNRLFTAFWPIVQSRIFVKLRSLVSQSLVPVSLCGAGAGLGAYAASAVAFPLGYGALLGAAAVAGVLGLLRLYARLFPPQPSSRFVSVFRTQRETPSGRLITTETRVRSTGNVFRR